jgi:hypothetical protein
MTPLLSLAGATALVADVVTPDPDTVTPGIIGFVATFGIAIVTVLLIIDMVRRVRRVNYRAQVREELEAEVAAQTATAAGAAAPGAEKPADEPDAGERRQPL